MWWRTNWFSAWKTSALEPPVMRRRVEEVLDQLEISHLRRRQLSTLSGGERQRVAIAAVLTTQPRILVLDEPTSQLDPHAAEEVLTALQKLNADLGSDHRLSEHRSGARCAICRSDHLLPRAAQIGDDGAQFIMGPPESCYVRHPSRRRWSNWRVAWLAAVTADDQGCPAIPGNDDPTVAAR